MGTNYYVEEESKTCPTCGHVEGGDEIHIGKSSAGWCFSLHHIPDLELVTLDSWSQFLKDKQIKDEYGGLVDHNDFMAIVLDRGRGISVWDERPSGYTSWVAFHAQNYSIQGPHGLIRHRDCVYHGDEEPWDMIEGEFS